MKKTIIISLCTIAFGFIGGIFFERTASHQALDEIIETSQEACDMRIKTLKATCKK